MHDARCTECEILRQSPFPGVIRTVHRHRWCISESQFCGYVTRFVGRRRDRTAHIVLGTRVGSIVCELGFHTSVREKSQLVLFTGPSRGLCRQNSAFCTVTVRIGIVHFNFYGVVPGPKVTKILPQNE